MIKHKTPIKMIKHKTPIKNPFASLFLFLLEFICYFIRVNNKIVV